MSAGPGLDIPWLMAEFAIPLPGGHRLILAGGSLSWLWLLAGAGAVALLLLLYRYERALVSRTTGLLLLGLRLAAASILILALFEPVAVRTYEEQVRGRLVLGVDLSESMATADPSRSAADQQALRQVLGLSAGTDTHAITRREVERGLLVGPWLDRLAAAADVRVVGFARGAASDVSAEALAQQLNDPPAADDPELQATDWQPVLEQAMRDTGTDSAPMLGVVLLTDGRLTVPDSAERAAVVDRLAARGVPVWSVAIGSTQPPRDAAIASVRLPDRVARGDTADVEVTVKLDGLASGTEVPVRLERPGHEPLQKVVRARDQGERPRVSFHVPLEQTGLQPLTVSLGPVDDDARADNDRRTVAVDVTDDKTRVLLIDGTPRWEFQYLRNALARDPRVDLDTVVFRQPPSPEGGGATYPNVLPAERAGEPDPLNAYDVIILGDVTAQDWPSTAWSRLDHFVDRRGGTLIASAGPASFESAWQDEAAQRILPVRDMTLVPVDTTRPDLGRTSLPAGVRIRPIAQAVDDWPMLRFAAEPDRSRAAWDSLPVLPWVLAGRAKPAATPLMQAEGAGIDPESATTLAAMPHGLGQVLWLGTDGTWRWRLRAGDVYHHRFWGQAVRWAGLNRLTAGNDVARFGPLRARVPEGQAATIRARFAEDVPSKGPGLLVAARVYRARVANDSSSQATPEGEPVAIVPLRPAPLQPRVFEAAAPLLPPGFYVIGLDAPQVAGGPTDLASFEVTSGGSLERVELAVAREPLDALAQATAGSVFADHEADRLLPLVQAQNRPRTRTETSSLWDRPLTLCVFFSLLACEWIARKRSGLP